MNLSEMSEEMNPMETSSKPNEIDDKKQEENRVNEIAASSIRSGLAELELKTSQVLQRLENVKTLPASSPTKSTTSSKDNEHNVENIHENYDDDDDEGISNDNDEMISKNLARMHLFKMKIPSLLDNERKMPADILKNLEYLVAYSNNEEDPEFPLPALDDVSHLALISHSIVAYLSHLDRQQLLRVTGNIAGETTQWLGNLFHFQEAASSFHADSADAILRTVRLAIVSRCPGYLEGGIPALAQPCFYVSKNISPMRLQYACRQLGIPLESIKMIPANNTFGTMDLSAFQKQVQLDVAAKRTPLLVVADIGASLCGYVDNLLRMHNICQAHDIWLHASGHGLAALVCAQIQGTISPIVDSIVLNLGCWLGVPSLPIVLLHRQLKNSALSAFEADPILSKRLNSLSLWTSLQALGRNSIAERLNVAFQTTNILFEIASKCLGIRVLSRAPGAQSGKSLNEVINSPLDVNLLFETAAPVVVFQFDGSITIPPSTTPNEKEPESIDYNKVLEKGSNISYFDRLNSWLGQILQSDCPNFDFEIIEHPTNGTCIRYCPLELGLGEQPPSSENLEQFAISLETHVDILRATIKHKATFIQLVEKNEVLRLVPLPEWAGMGGVRFVPEGWESLLTDRAKTELNKLNVDLVETLKSTDSAFSLGEGIDGLICVRFGMVTHETDVEELLELVVSVGKSVQENSKVLDTMSEIVKKGIETATADLQRESEEKLWQEGILRHVPVVGRVVNWWSPPNREVGIKGRSLNLTQGVVESTENIYKYHMQMSGYISQLPANKSPPTPMVQTPVINPSIAPSFPSPAPSVDSSVPSIAPSNDSPAKQSPTGHTRNTSHSSVASSTAPDLVPIKNP